MRIPEFRVQYNHFNKIIFWSDCLQYISYVQMIKNLLEIRTAFWLLYCYEYIKNIC